MEDSIMIIVEAFDSLYTSDMEKFHKKKSSELELFRFDKYPPRIIIEIQFDTLNGKYQMDILNDYSNIIVDKSRYRILFTKNNKFVALAYLVTGVHVDDKDFMSGYRYGRRFIRAYNTVLKKQPEVILFSNVLINQYNYPIIPFLKKNKIYVYSSKRHRVYELNKFRRKFEPAPITTPWYNDRVKLERKNNRYQIIPFIEQKTQN